MANALALAPVEFHGVALTTTTIDGNPYVAMRPIVSAIGLDWAAQFSRIKRHPVLSTSVVVMTTQMPGDDQAREVFFLPLKMLNGWLFGVNANRVKPEIQNALIQYQRECFDVLAAHFAPVQRPFNPALDYDRISPAQAQELRELVQLVVASGKQGHGETWNRLHRKMKVNSYLQLPAAKFGAALDYLRGKMDGNSLLALAQKHFPGSVQLTLSWAA